MYKALTLEEIIESLTDPKNQVDTKLLNIFLYTYRTYCTPLEIINLIKNRLMSLHSLEGTLNRNVEERDGFVKATIMYINAWLTMPFAYDFYEFPHFKSLNLLLKSIREWPKQLHFIRANIQFRESFKKLESKIQDLLNNFSILDATEKTGYREVAIDCQFEDTLTVCSDIKCESVHMNFLDYPPNEIATCLTYIDQLVLKKLRLQEMLKHIKKEPAPSVTAVITNYNQLHNVVKILVISPQLARYIFQHQQPTYSANSSPILPNTKSHKPIDNPVNYEGIFRLSPSPQFNDDSSYRVAVIEKWILVAYELYSIRNYSSLVAILTALNSSELKPFMNHFKKTKKSSKLYNNYLNLLKIIEPTINQNKDDLLRRRNSSEDTSKFFSSFGLPKGRIKLKQHHPEIPYLGLFLRHLTYINDGFDDYNNSEADRVYNGSQGRPINLDKCRKQFDVLAQVRLCISALNCNPIEPNYTFNNWYSMMEMECRNRSDTVSCMVQTRSPTISVDSLVSCNSSDSSIDLTHNHLLGRSNASQYKSVECLDRRRLASTPIANNSTEKPTKPRMYTHTQNNHSVSGSLCSLINVKYVKVRIILPNQTKTVTAVSATRFSSSRYTRITNCANNSVRTSSAGHKPPLPTGNSINRSASSAASTSAIATSAVAASSVDKGSRKESFNLTNVNYKKIEVFENDHTNDFLIRAFKKFDKPNLRPSDFQVIQILEKDNVIQIPASSNMYYALAERPEYNIEIRYLH